ncbi:FAD-dependent monooxygenase [Deinococcus psychrotolerans]|uniref:FAD-dependent monooxygenase n=1 Tax=Deinococcus psychrotolerans TaxID=2489213 RepID=UPI00267C7A2F
MALPCVLISGAGIAGPTLAYWLARSGWQPTVVERAGRLRSSGNPVDVRGAALSVAEKMGIVAALRSASTSVRAISFYDRAGHRFARVPTSAGRSAAGTPEMEIPRSDLARVLFQAASDVTEFLFDDTITALHQDAGGVDVTFERHAPRRFDLVIGADGLHSAVRQLAFGPDEQFVRHMGTYVATTALPEPVKSPQDVLMYNTPGRLVAVHPGRDCAMVGFFFWHPAAAPDCRNPEAVKRFVAAAYAGVGWRVPELLA